ncbi:MAG: hypothetical protein AB7L90_06045 [Hyphomicrobiaceae bacterium]
MLMSIPVEEIRRRGSVRDRDVAALRAAYDSREEVTEEEAEALFALHVATPVQDPAWADLFIEIITDYIVDQAPPAGYLMADNSRWLIEQVSAFGRIETSTEFNLLLHVLERARWSPPTLSAFALDQIRHAVERGSGPLRATRNVPPGTIAANEVALASRILGAAGGDTSLALTRAEADALLAVNRAIDRDGASPAWSELLVRTIGSSVLASLGHAVAPRREIIDTLGNPAGAAGLISVLIGDGMHRFSRPGRCGDASDTACQVWRSARLLTPEEQSLMRLERQRLEIVTNEVIEDASDIWLIDALAQSRPDDETEAALLDFVIREASQLSPEIEQYARRRAIAA